MLTPLVLALTLAAPADALAPAREALEKGELARAEVLALAAAVPPHEGAALDVVGAARFRSGRPAEALAAFERADRAADPPPRGRSRFNEAACLEALGNLAEAEARYIEAARGDPSLAALALASAGWAAFDGGARDRARTLAEQARAAGGPGTSVAEDLLARLGDADEQQRRTGAAAEHAAGVAAYDAGRWDEARAAFLRAIALDPSSGPSRIMAGAAAARAGDLAQARELLTAALAMPLTASEARAARAHLAALFASTSLLPLGFSGAFHAGGGADSDVLASDIPRAGGLVSSSRVKSTFASSGLLVRYRTALGESGQRVLEVGYRAEEVAYLAREAQDYSVQEHTAWAGLEAPMGGRFRAGLQLSGQYTLTGWSRLRGLQAAGTVGGFGALDEGRGSSTRLYLEGTALRGEGREFAYLTGARWDAALTQALNVGRFTVRAAYALRLDQVGTIPLSGTWPVPNSICPFGACPQRYEVPLSFLEQRLGLTGRIAMGTGLDLTLSAAGAFRAYRDESTLVVSDSFGQERRLDPVHRRDGRLILGGATVFHPGRSIDLTLSGEYTAVHSNVARRRGSVTCEPPDFQCHALDYGDMNAHRTVVGADLGWRW